MVDSLLYQFQLVFSYIHQPLERIRQVKLPDFGTCNAAKRLNILFCKEPVLTTATTVRAAPYSAA